MAGLSNYLQGELDKKFGEGRIEVSGINGKLNFETKNLSTNTTDTSSVLSISSGDSGLLGKNGALNVNSGESNRLNLTSSLIDSGLTSDFSGKNEDDELKLVINGEPITGLTYGSSLNDIINKINASDAGVTVSYLKNADKFSIVSKADGAAGKIEFGSSDNSADLFNNYTIKPGVDAIVSVKYDGADDPVEIIRGNNSFNLDGLNITVNGTFGYSEGVLVEDTEPITFNAKTDTDSIVSAVSDMVKDFNEIIDLVNKEVTTKPNRSYEPLTDEQKEGMSEDQIKLWEEKAKAGMLFNDSELRSLSDNMRFIFDSGSPDKAALNSFGISTSSSYGDNGKLVFNETKFRAALESNPEDLQKLFTKGADTTTGDKGGVMARLTEITEKYASTTGSTKGILIERAGSLYAPTSILNNALQKSMDSLDTIIDRFNDQLQTETDRYIKQFTSLETLISQMNSQSSWLSSALG